MFFPDRITKIKDNDKVLEIGPGSQPYQRADVYLEKSFTSDEAFQQNGNIEAPKLEKPIVYYQNLPFPFKDKEFDYVICSHVIEHIPIEELPFFIAELQRIAYRGYLEFPTVFYELICYPEVHKWFMNFRDGNMLFLNKKVFKTNTIHKVYRELFYGNPNNQYLVKNFQLFKQIYFYGYEWIDEIKYEIVNKFDELVSDSDLLSYIQLVKNNNYVPELREVIVNKCRFLELVFKSLRNIKNKFVEGRRIKGRIIKRFKDEFKNLNIKNNKSNRFHLNWEERYPILNEKNKVSGFDRHYIYHTAWAIRKLNDLKPQIHFDFSSSLYFNSLASANHKIVFTDFNKPDLQIENLEVRNGELTNLKEIKSNSLMSISCMHVVEHIGLGRYGDNLDYDGDLKAINELKRILSPNGDLLFVVPIGATPKIIFNAHRIYSHKQILEYFKEFKLKEFTLIPQNPQDGHLVTSPSDILIEKQNYACGCYWFIKL